jgi:hypothetical protein
MYNQTFNDCKIECLKIILYACNLLGGGQLSGREADHARVGAEALAHDEDQLLLRIIGLRCALYRALSWYQTHLVHGWV